MTLRRFLRTLAVVVALLAGLAFETTHAASRSGEITIIVPEVKASVEKLSPLIAETDIDGGTLTLVEPGDWTIEERKAKRAEMRVLVKDLDPTKIHYEPHKIPYVVNGKQTVGAIYIACAPDKKCMRLSYVAADNGDRFKITEGLEKATIDIVDGAEVETMRSFAQSLQRWIKAEQGS